MRTAAFALETTGLDPWKTGIVRASASVWQDGHEVISISAVCHPGQPVGETVEFHGLTDEAVAGAPGWEKISRLIAAHLEGVDQIVVHTEKFQRLHWVVQSSRWEGAPASFLWEATVIDVADLARAITKRGRYASGYDLPSLVDRLKCESGPQSTRAQSVMSVYNALLVHAGEDGPEAIIERWRGEQSE